MSLSCDGVAVGGSGYTLNVCDAAKEVAATATCSFSNSLKNGDMRVVQNNGKPIIEYYCNSNWKKFESEEEKENKNMFNFDFGPVGDNIRMSLYGLAIKGANGTYVAYDTKTKSIMDVEILNFNAKNFIYKVPAALKDIKEGDIIIHNKKPMYIIEIQGRTISCIDIFNGEAKVILVTRSPFGFDYVTKVVALTDMMGGANESNPFGNMWPLMLMDNTDVNMTDVMMMMTLSGNNGQMNPMMMAMFMADGKDKDKMLPYLMMMNGFGVK